MALNWSLQHKRDTAANWTANNPTLLAGQLGIETDNLTTTPKFKVGDGVTVWNSLPYFYGGSLSAQDIANVLSVGNDTGGLSLKMNTGTTYYGATNQAHIQNVSGLELHNSIANTLCNLTDAGLWKVDATQYMPNLTASRLLSLDSNKYVVNETGTGILTLTGGVISYDTNTYLTTGAAALTYQPLDADLTSWAGVTRAANFDTFVATPSSANLISLVTDETGSGSLVFGTSPTFTTDITTPLIIGGSAVGSNITYKSTSGTGTTTAVAHTFTGGTNGGTTIATLYNNGNVNIGNYASPTAQRLVTIGQDTAYVSIGSVVGATSSVGIYFNQLTPAVYNYALRGDSGGSTYLNCANQNNNIYIQISGNLQSQYTLGTQIHTPSVITSGAVTPFTFTIAANTGQTASTEIPNFKITGNTKTWATGALATQRFNYFSANTAAAAGASTFTAIHNFYSDAPLAGSNMTATNLYAAGFGGHVFIANSVGVPSNNPTGGGVLYVESGALKYRGSSGTITTLGAA